MGRSNEEIVALFHDRETRTSAMKQTAREVRDAYHSDMALPMPELDEIHKSTAANLVQLGIDQTSRRVASTSPTALFLPDNDSQAARERSRARSSIVRDWQKKEALRQKLKRLARHFCGYTEAILTVTPGRYQRACWRVRDPLDSYPADVEQETPSVPDCIFRSSRTAGWARHQYPEVGLPSSNLIGDETPITILEYLDANERISLFTWSESDFYAGNGHGSARFNHVALGLEYSPIAVARRPGLARPAGQMDGAIGTYFAMSMLQALEMIAVKKSVFNDEWFVSDGTTTPQIIKKADGLKGIVGTVVGGKPWVNTTQPGFMAPAAIDRYERDIRTTGVVPAEFGGESASNVRTGKRGDSILAAAIDFVVQEAQEAFAPMIEAANLAAIDYDRSWYADRQAYFWLKEYKSEKRQNYSPRDLWKDGAERHTVSYSYAGSDANTLIVGIGQRLGIETMSHQTAMEIDPLIDDPEQEHDSIIAEQLERALMMGLSAQGQQGAIPPADLARISYLVRNDKMDLDAAVQKVQEEAQARQATQVPPTDPAAQPGIAQPGAGAEAAATVQPPDTGQSNVSQMLSSLGVVRRQMAAR